MTRRNLLITGAEVAGVWTVAAFALTTNGGTLSALAAESSNVATAWDGHLPVEQIEDIMETNGTVMNGVLTIEQDRTDLHVVGPHGLP